MTIAIRHQLRRGPIGNINQKYKSCTMDARVLALSYPRNPRMVLGRQISVHDCNISPVGFFAPQRLKPDFLSQRADRRKRPGQPSGHLPSGKAETYSYDNVGNLLTKIDRKGQLISYGYDEM